jgi:hypothetical protein
MDFEVENKWRKELPCTKTTISWTLFSVALIFQAILVILHAQ